jgi:ectoine hydroxylase-related dioxygenase (phytanoyl-CoA dioxygenase family)
MNSGYLDSLQAEYRERGFLSPIDILSNAEAAAHRAQLEGAEAVIGNLHYQSKIHTVMRSPLALATDERVLDIVASLIGPDILLYNCTYIIKEPASAAHVSWHQDLTYWGFDGDAQVSLWLALSAADETSGCMQMLPGSHRRGSVPHRPTDDSSNVLLQGQTATGIDTRAAVHCPLRPGQASFHHGWTLHCSAPNRSDDRRIGLNVQYIAPHMRQTKPVSDSALLVRGRDRFGHFEPDLPATSDLDEAALEKQRHLHERYVATAGSS